MPSLQEKIEAELCSLMGETGKLTLSRCLRKIGADPDNGDGNLPYLTKVALVEELSKTFSMLMPEEKVWRFKLKLLSLKGDD